MVIQFRRRAKHLMNLRSFLILFQKSYQGRNPNLQLLTTMKKIGKIQKSSQKNSKMDSL